MSYGYPPPSGYAAPPQPQPPYYGGPPKKRIGAVTITLLVVGALAVLVVIGAFGAALAMRGTEPNVATAATDVPDPTPAPPPKPVATPAEHVDKLTFASAVTYAKPQMTDTVNEPSPGAALLAIWASKHMRWTDVAVTTDETSYALTRKDPDEARGKRLCTSGQIIQIEVEKVSNVGKFSEGLLMNGAGNLYDFIAVGTSGALVQESYARFCGVVTGTYDYSNSGGGTGHAIELVGMFDLPQNKTR